MKMQLSLNEAYVYSFYLVFVLFPLWKLCKTFRILENQSSMEWNFKLNWVKSFEIWNWWKNTRKNSEKSFSFEISMLLFCILDYRRLYINNNTSHYLVEGISQGGEREREKQKIWSKLKRLHVLFKRDFVFNILNYFQLKQFICWIIIMGKRLWIRSYTCDTTQVMIFWTIFLEEMAKNKWK